MCVCVNAGEKPFQCNVCGKKFSQVCSNFSRSQQAVTIVMLNLCVYACMYMCACV